MPLAITITNEQKIPVTINPLSPSGKPAKLDGVPTWTRQTGDSTAVPSGTGLSCDLISSDTPGDSTFLVEADADLGAGVVSISDVITLTVVGVMAANLGLLPGTAVDK